MDHTHFIKQTRLDPGSNQSWISQNTRADAPILYFLKPGKRPGSLSGSGMKNLRGVSRVFRILDTSTRVGPNWHVPLERHLQSRKPLCRVQTYLNHEPRYSTRVSPLILLYFYLYILSGSCLLSCFKNPDSRASLSTIVNHHRCQTLNSS